jgi:hypothetical protein
MSELIKRYRGEAEPPEQADAAVADAQHIA